MHPFLLPATLLLGLPATALASSATARDVAVVAANPILTILTNITDTSISLDDQTDAGKDINLDRQYGNSVLYFIKFIHDLNKTRNNFPVLATPLTASEQTDTCNYFEKEYYKAETNLPVALSNNCLSSAIKGAWCNYLVICLREFIPILADVEAKIISNLPSCTARLQSRVSAINVFQAEAVDKIEKGHYYINLPFSVPQGN
ncbi:hypothetical protein E4U55_003767 [Claviceps digitariae]|nr:hypothetical protein E4U55_003767 [Claviceps digitariae]